MTQVPHPSPTWAGKPGNRGRFAPSPTGRLHFGSLVAALGSWLRARAQRGVWVVRMEDVDKTRDVNGAADEILETLAAFGMVSDVAVIRQSARSERYATCLQQLIERDLAYSCHCTRNDLSRFGGIHPATCVVCPPGDRRPGAWRVRVGAARLGFDDAVYGHATQDLGRDVGDFTLLRADGCYTYQFAVVVDDGDQGITEVVRGADLLESTPRQIHLQHLLGLPTPHYMHLPLAVDSKGRKLSKHDRARPVDPADPLPALRAALAFLGQDLPRANRVRDVLREAAMRFEAGKIPPTRNMHAAMRKD